VTLAQANADIGRLIPVSVERFPGGLSLSMLEQAQFGPDVHPLIEDFVGDVGGVLWVLLGTVGLLLLIACANVANLFLVRAEGRQQEVAVRTAMGAGRGRIARQFLLESVVLGVLSGIVGLGLAFAGTQLLVRFGPDNLPRMNQIGVDPAVLGFTFVLSVLAGLIFGLFPVLRLRTLSLVAALKEGGRGSSTGKERHRARNALVVAQVAIAMVLLVGSGLMFRTFQALRQVDPGFERPEEVISFRIALPSAEVPDPEQAAQAIEEIQRRLEQIPGVASVGASFSLPMDGYDSNDAAWIEDAPTPEGQIPPIRRYKWVGGNYFETIERTLVAGRTITWADIHDRTPVVVITENMAREYWDDPSAAIGRRVGSGDPADILWREIVGVVGDVPDDGVSQDLVSTVYFPYVTGQFRGEDLFVQRFMAYAVRSRGPQPTSLLPAIREAVWAVNPNLPVANVRTLEEIFDRSMVRTSFTMVLLGIAAAVALLLGSVGIYGVISYVVSQRTREIGVRMALGADRTDVSRLVLRQGLGLVAAGVGVGLASAFGLTRLMTSLLYGVRAADPLTYALVAVALATVAMLASYLPARRASGVDPVTALRWE
jgi:predicted permease